MQINAFHFYRIDANENIFTALQLSEINRCLQIEWENTEIVTANSMFRPKSNKRKAQWVPMGMNYRPVASNKYV